MIFMLTILNWLFIHPSGTRNGAAVASIAAFCTHFEFQPDEAESFRTEKLLILFHRKNRKLFGSSERFYVFFFNSKRNSSVAQQFHFNQKRKLWKWTMKLKFFANSLWFDHKWREEKNFKFAEFTGNQFASIVRLQIFPPCNSLNTTQDMMNFQFQRIIEKSSRSITSLSLSFSFHHPEQKSRISKIYSSVMTGDKTFDDWTAKSAKSSQKKTRLGSISLSFSIWSSNILILFKFILIELYFLSVCLCLPSNAKKVWSSLNFEFDFSPPPPLASPWTLFLSLNHFVIRLRRVHRLNIYLILFCKWIKSS